MKEKPPMKKVIAQKKKQEWVMDKKGYVLIDPRPKEGLLYAHHYYQDKTYHCSIEGKDAESIYYTLLREKLIGSLMHAAYIGSELQKAEQTLHQKNLVYMQDKPLQKKSKVQQKSKP